MKKFTSVFMLGMLGFACKTESVFQGSNERKSPVVVVSVPPMPYVSPLPTPTPVIQPSTDCPEGRFTEARLISRELTSKKTPQYLDYELSVSDCKGPQKVTSSQILFDIDYAISDRVTPYSYRVESTSGRLIGQGQMRTIEGSDLFGNPGQEFAHFRTDDFQIVESDTFKIRFRIDFSGREFADTLHNSRGKAQTYLKFGNANVSKKGEESEIRIIGATPKL